VTFFHIATIFGLFHDVEVAKLGLYYNTATEATVHLLTAWNNYFKNAGPCGPILAIAHSRGAIDERNALAMISKEHRKKIFVLAIAPAAVIDYRLCAGVRHFGSKRDIVPSARSAWKKRTSWSDSRTSTTS